MVRGKKEEEKRGGKRKIAILKVSLSPDEHEERDQDALRLSLPILLRFIFRV